MQRFQILFELAQLLGLQPAQALLGRRLVQHRPPFLRRQLLQKPLARFAHEFFHRVGHARVLQNVGEIQTAEQLPSFLAARAIVRRAMSNLILPRAEELPEGIARVRVDLVQHDHPDHRRAPLDVIHPRAGGGRSRRWLVSPCGWRVARRTVESRTRGPTPLSGRSACG
jgi:hypothetical protein